MTAAPVGRRAAVVVVAHNGRDDLPASLGSVRAHAAHADLYVVDNASHDGSAALVARDFPEATLLPQKRNLGFAGGCNAGIRAAQRAGTEHILLLNQDAELRAGALDALCRFLDAHPDAAAVQPAIYLPDGRCNSLGNHFHYLGFSAAGGNGLSVADAERVLPWLAGGRWRGGVEVPSCSGAVLMLRGAALREVGLLEEELFLYHEDLELCLRLRRAGWSVWLLGSAEAVHHYEFSRTPDKWYYMERNRHWVLLAHLRPRTLAVLGLPLAGAEAAVWALALRDGWAGRKWRAYRYWSEPGRIAHLRARRADLRRLRRRGDGEILASASATAGLDDLGGPVARVLSAVSTAAWRLLRPLIR